MVRMGLADRFIDIAERVSGAFLALVTALTFLTVVLRYIFNWSIPDSYDFSRNFLGILIFWGIAVTGFRGDHISVDLLWGALPPRPRHWLDLFGTAFVVVAMGYFCWTMGEKVIDTYHSNVTTYDLNLPVWPFYVLAWLGTLAAVVLAAVRLLRQVQGRMGPDHVPGTGPDAPILPMSH